MKILFWLLILTSIASATECAPGYKAILDNNKYVCIPADPNECSPGFIRKPATDKNGVVIIENGNIIFSCKLK